MPAVVKIKRSELYELVWQQPMLRLARSYHLSDVGLAKICRKHAIPRPPRGYWAQLQHGQKPLRTPLPSAQDIEIEIRDPGGAEMSGLVLDEETQSKLADEQRPESQITVLETLRGSHRLVSLASEQFQNQRVDDNGLLARPQGIVLDLAVSRNSLRRALRIMDALLKATEHRGYEVSPGPKAKIGARTLRFSITEHVGTQREHCGEQDLDAPYTFGHSRIKEKRVPSGLLTLAIEHGQAPWARNCQSKWRDTESRKLESRLNEFMAGLIELGARAHQHDQEQRRQMELLREQQRIREEELRQGQLREQEAARQRAEKRKQYKEELARVDTLVAQAESLQKSRMIWELVDAVKEAHGCAGGNATPGSELAEWIKWATQQADRLDPLLPSPPSILDEPVEEEPPQANSQSRGWR